ncbi:hypothetical protein SCUP515_00006 [Seiridium cupressi]
MGTFNLITLLFAATVASAIAVTPGSSLHPLDARCHCDGHCCGSSWCLDSGEMGDCIDGVPYCDRTPYSPKEMPMLASVWQRRFYVIGDSIAVGIMVESAVHDLKGQEKLDPANHSDDLV